MPRTVPRTVLAGLLVTGLVSGLAGCTASDEAPSTRAATPATGPAPESPSTPAGTPSGAAGRQPSTGPADPVSTGPTPSTGSSGSSGSSGRRSDPRWRFFTRDHGGHSSPWFAGTHRVMIGYGCTVAPYYAHDERCPGRQGFHHGIDVAMPCGTRLFAGRSGTVLDPSSAGAPGPAYGPYAFRIRSGGVDVLIGHVRRVYVDPGDAVRRGELIARANDQGAPDGCHLHFEVRHAGGGLDDAVDPASYLRLS